ncbi:MAG: putative bifunctional diguanylate cyclase/phosphodiesterase [Deltaproteobacteria bacterium]|jgi:diguanylate cyclase (GGDEF)-like protein/PAS domain S-box-containing protein
MSAPKDTPTPTPSRGSVRALASTSVTRGEPGHPEAQSGHPEAQSDHRRSGIPPRDSVPVRIPAVAQREQFRLLFDEAPVGMLLRTPDGSIVRANEAFATLLGYRVEELVGKHLDELLVAEDVSAHDLLAQALRKSVESGEHADSQTVDKRLLRADGRVVNCRSVTRVVEGDQGEPLVLSTVVDETERKEIERRLRYEAFHDRMTGLPNRALFLDRLGQALLRDATGHVVVVGLDRLRSVNEAFGHSVGDRVVVDVARRLVAAVGRGDTVARIGGDEFAVLVTSGWDDATLDVLNAAARPTLHPDGRELLLTASMGVRELRGLEAPELVLGDALLALQRAKELGRNRTVVYEPTLRGRASRVAAIARNLRDAVVRKEIDVEYQPIHRTADGALTGFEALVRWRRSSLGAVPPAEFVPVAEERGLIQLIGAYVLGESLAQLARWRALSPHADELTMSVNLSPVQARDPSHMELLRHMIADSDIPADRVKVEITESVFVDLTTEIADGLVQLRSAGVQLVLDDFGTGYSSLNHLQALPFDGLKVDRSFVVRAMEDPRSRNLVRSIASLARGLDMHSTAEGVELSDQRAFLTEVGFDFLQGFLFGRPMPSDVIDAMVSARRP